MNVFAENKGVANHYDLQDKFEAGLVLRGYEVKAVRAGKVSIKGAFIEANASGARLVSANISAYQKNNVPLSYNPRRARALLLRAPELRLIIGASHQHGLTLVPLSLYNKNSKIKLAFAIGKGLKKHDQREKIKKKEFKRRMNKLMAR